jgi:hypothetical protein
MALDLIEAIRQGGEPVTAGATAGGPSRLQPEPMPISAERRMDFPLKERADPFAV